MDAEYKPFEESIPSLTLEPELESAPQLAVAEEISLQQPKVAEPVLTPEEQKKFDDSIAAIRENMAKADSMFPVKQN